MLCEQKENSDKNENNDKNDTTVNDMEITANVVNENELVENSQNNNVETIHEEISSTPTSGNMLFSVSSSDNSCAVASPPPSHSVLPSLNDNQLDKLPGSAPLAPPQASVVPRVSDAVIPCVINDSTPSSDDNSLLVKPHSRVHRTPPVSSGSVRDRSQSPLSHSRPCAPKPGRHSLPHTVSLTLSRH